MSTSSPTDPAHEPPTDPPDDGDRGVRLRGSREAGPATLGAVLRVPVSRSLFVKTGLISTLTALVLGAEHFARYDFLGIAFQNPGTTYTTATGRLIDPASIDEIQYLSYVRDFRGTPNPLVTEAVWPFENRVFVPYLSHFLPFKDEAVAMAVTNAVLYIGAIWILLDLLRRRGVSERVFVLSAVLLVFNWNTVWFSTATLIDPGVLFFMAIGCWLLLCGPQWLLPPLLLFGYPVKESVLALAVVVMVWSVQEPRKLRERLPIGVLSLAAAAVSFLFWHNLQEPDRSFDNSLRIGVFVSNLDPTTVLPFAAGSGLILLLAAVQVVASLREHGLRRTVTDPMVAGYAIGLGIVVYAMFSADLSPRLIFTGLPFAVVLAAQALGSSAHRVTDTVFRLPLLRRIGAPGPEQPVAVEG